MVSRRDEEVETWHVTSDVRERCVRESCKRAETLNPSLNPTPLTLRCGREMCGREMRERERDAWERERDVRERDVRKRCVCRKCVGEVCERDA